MEQGLIPEVETLERRPRSDGKGSCWFFQGREVDSNLATALTAIYKDGWRVKAAFSWAEVPAVILERMPVMIQEERVFGQAQEEAPPTLLTGRPLVPVGPGSVRREALSAAG